MGEKDGDFPVYSGTWGGDCLCVMVAYLPPVACGNPQKGSGQGSIAYKKGLIELLGR